ncbi:MAG: cytoplasmic protein [Clostridia bacterium]|nr:cytoplasmic protein [Clostridia bacterium]
MHKDDLTGAHKACIRNRQALAQDTRCGCFHCLKIFSPHQITDYIREKDGSETAKCPYCGVDSVIGAGAGYPLTEEFLLEMHRHWFENIE